MGGFDAMPYVVEKGPAVLFEKPIREDGSPYDMPVLINLFGTVERVAWGMDRALTGLQEIGETLAFLRQPEPPAGWKDAFKMLPLLKTVMAMKPKSVKVAPCQEIVWRGDQIDLGRLPIQTCWPGEPAPLITWPLVVTQGPHADGLDPRDSFWSKVNPRRAVEMGVIRRLRHPRAVHALFPYGGDLAVK